MGIIVRGTVFCVIIVIYKLLEIIITLVFNENIEIIWILMCIDSVINTIIVLLYFSFADNIYNKYCQYCHECVTSIMIRCFG